MILAETPRRKLVNQLVTWGHWFALQNIIVAVIIASIFVFSTPLPATFGGIAYLLVTWFSHIAFITFFSFVILVLPLCYVLGNPKVVKGIAALFSALGLALLVFDALLYNKYGTHLSLTAAGNLRDQSQNISGEWQQWLFFVVLVLVWLAFQLIIANALWKRLQRFSKVKVGIPITAVLVSCFVLSHSAHIWADANLYQPIVQQDNMFPLSYPATAKNLMAKYDLLDLQNHQTRRQLQFNQQIQQVNYPSKPVYCAIQPQGKTLLLIQSDQTDWQPGGADLVAQGKHHDLSADPNSRLLSALYGLPQLYLPALQGKQPVLLNLPHAQGLPVLLYANSTVPALQDYQVSLTDLTQQLSSQDAYLAVAFADASTLKQILSEAQGAQVLLQTNNDQGSQLYSNMSIRAQQSSTEDLAATLLSTLGCQSEPAAYSTGQNLLSPSRDWLVSTQGNKVVVLQPDKRIEVKSNGNYKQYDLAQRELDTPLDTNLLAQAIRHLSRFKQN